MGLVDKFDRQRGNDSALLEALYPEFYAQVGENYSKTKMNQTFAHVKKPCQNCKKPTKGIAVKSNIYCSECMARLLSKRKMYGVRGQIPGYAPPQRERGSWGND